MFDEIEQFIKKAAQAAQEAADKARREQEAKRRPPPPQRPAKKQRPPQRKPPQASPQVLDAEIVEDGLAARRLPAARLSSLTETDHLAHDVELADDKMQAHVQGVFEHKLGRLQQSAAEPQAVNNAGIDLIAKMLTNPRDVRNAIILAEVLKRPEF